MCGTGVGAVYTAHLRSPTSRPIGLGCRNPCFLEFNQLAILSPQYFYLGSSVVKPNEAYQPDTRLRVGLGAKASTSSDDVTIRCGAPETGPPTPYHVWEGCCTAVEGPGHSTCPA